MKLTVREQQRLDALLRKYRYDSKVLEMKKYLQHGTVSTYDHVERVTRASYWLNRRLHLGANERVLVAGAFLHDFYLYDWHTDSEGLHGFYHPGIACRNAMNRFHVDPPVQNIIRSHMWPLTLTVLPLCREAWIVCMADKYIAILEALRCRRTAG